MNQPIQPSGDFRATALVIATSIYAFVDYDDKGSVPAGLDGKKKAAQERIKLIAAAAKELCDAVKM